MFKAVGVLVVAFGASALALPAESATTVTLRFQGPNEEPVSLRSAELLFSGWGYADQVKLKPEGNAIRLVLDPGAELTPGLKYSEAEQTFLYIEADGYASWRSERFDWPAGPSFTPTRIGPVAIAPIDNVTGTITLRRAVTRRVRLLDESGAPVTNVALTVSMFWSNAGHCGYFTGARRLLTNRTDSSGAVLVPDVDSEYALQLDGPHMAFVDEAIWPSQAIVRLPQADNTVRIHRYRRRPLRTTVVNRGVPVKGARLMVDLELGTCGIGSGPMGDESGADGVISVPDFYPEEWPFATVCYANKAWWEGAPADGVPYGIDIANVAGKGLYLCGQ